ncbi:hypothetical protein [Tunicatimonas pelagia]|uniref:hypothetical protein n=1 Tax=Tunicatimonas pelagia TaxID=931531 RepID=UPI0026661F44|nr:hypothetical protein [Tunicatimonas pelagia]WKN45806.1 hypothetical protein P0M28_12640 [Tunicatimonas pelagia]
MKRISVRFLVLLWGIVMSGLLIVSCGEDDDASNPPSPTPTPGTGNLLTITAMDATASIAENPTMGDVIDTLVATASTGTALLYSLLSQSVDGAVSVEASSGELKVAQVAAFDFETNPTISGEYVASAEGTSDTASFTITVTDVNEIQVNANTFLDSLDENSASGTVIGTLDVTVTGSSDPATYAVISQSPSGAVGVNAQGEVIVADSSLFDHETHSEITGTYTATVGTVTDTANFTVKVLNVEEVTVVDEDGIKITIADFSGSIDENSPAGMAIGTVSATVTGGTPTYSIASQSITGAVSINAQGQLSVADASAFDYETNTQITGKYKVVVGSQEAEANFTITINDITEPTTPLSATDFSGNVDENSPVNTIIGTVNATGFNGATPTYSIVSQSITGAVSINAQGEISIADATVFDFETNTQVTGRYKVVVDSQEAEADFTISINNVLEVMITANAFFGNVNENSEVNTAIGVLDVTVANGTGTPTYTIISQSVPNAVSINAQGQLLIATASSFDHETNPTITGTYQAELNGSTSSANFTIIVDDNDKWVVSVFAGTPGASGNTNSTGQAARFNDPKGMAFDSNGNLFVADAGNHRIRKITPTGVVTTFAGSTRGSRDGIGTSAQFLDPSDVEVDASGTIWVADFGTGGGAGRIRKITSAGVVTSPGAPGSSTIWGIAIYNNNIYASMFGGHAIEQFSISNNNWTTYSVGRGTAGSADGAPNVAQFNQPQGITADASGNLYVADNDNNKLRKIDTNNNVTTLAGSYFRISDVAIDSNGNIYITGNDRIWEIDTNGNSRRIATGFVGLQGLAIDAAGNVYVADSGNHCIKKLTWVD